MKIIFYKRRWNGYYCSWGNERLVIKSSERFSSVENSFYFSTSVTSNLAQIIEKYIIEEDFLNSSKRKIEKELSQEKWKLLQALKEAGPYYSALYYKALSKDFPQEKLEAQLVWRIL